MNPSDDLLFRVFAVTVAAFFGLNVGSFLNVVAHRLPLQLSVVRPRSRCPNCLTQIRAIDNIPVLSWLLLGGRCRGCKGRISARYAAVEILTAALAVHVVVAIVLLPQPDRIAEVAAWARAGATFLLVAAMLAASLIDLDHRILPDEITIPGMWAGPAVAAFLPEIVFGRASRGAFDVPSWVPDAWPVPLQAALVSGLGVAAGGLILWALSAVGSRVLGKDAMGFGDVKFLGMIGGFLGPGLVLVALVLAALVGSVVGVIRLLMTGDRYIPFGPFLAVGAYIALLHGHALVAWYLGFVLGAGAGGG